MNEQKLEGINACLTVISEVAKQYRMDVEEIRKTGKARGISAAWLEDFYLSGAAKGLERVHQLISDLRDGK